MGNPDRIVVRDFPAEAVLCKRSAGVDDGLPPVMSFNLLKPLEGFGIQFLPVPALVDRLDVQHRRQVRAPEFRD